MSCIIYRVLESEAATRGNLQSGSPSGHLRIARTESADGAIVLRLHGELDLDSAEALLTVLRAPENAGATEVLLDLGGLEFIDSTGISALVQARLKADEANSQLVLTNLTRNASRLLDIIGITSRFAIR